MYAQLPRFAQPAWPNINVIASVMNRIETQTITTVFCSLQADPLSPIRIATPQQANTRHTRGRNWSYAGSLRPHCGQGFTHTGATRPRHTWTQLGQTQTFCPTIPSLLTSLPPAKFIIDLPGFENMPTHVKLRICCSAHQTN